MDAFQLVCRSPRRRRFARDRASVRACVRRIVRVVGPALVAFHVSDTHVHVLVLATRAEAGRLAQALGLAMRAALGEALPATAVTAIEDGNHLAATFEYVLCNDERHGVEPDPWRENSNLPDLLGARLVAAGTIARVRELLPRVRGVHLRRLAGWQDVPTTPDPAGVRAHLADAAAAVLALPDLARLPRAGHPLLAAVARMACDAGLSPEDGAALIGRSRSTWFRWLATEPPVDARTALHRQLALRAARPLPPLASFADEPERAGWADRARVLPR